MRGRQADILNRTIRTGFTEKERHLSQASQKTGLTVNQKKSIPGRQRGGYKDPMGCQGVRQSARRPGQLKGSQTGSRAKEKKYT